MTYLIVGSSGTVGRSVVGGLERRVPNLRLLVRNEARAAELAKDGIEVAVGTLEAEPGPGLRSALEGVETVFLLTSPSETMVVEHRAFIDLAASSGVRKIVRVSAVTADPASHLPIGRWHGQADGHLMASGLQYVLLRPHWFMQNILQQAPMIASDGVFIHSMADAEVPMIDTRDIARAAVAALLSDDFDGQQVVLTGPAAIRQTELASALTSALGKTVHAKHLPWSEHRPLLESFGAPSWAIETIGKLSQDFTEGTFCDVTHDYQRLTHLDATDIGTFVTDHVASFRN